jgi:hypothetical protein
VRDGRIAVGDTVAVVVEPEGPQREDLAGDLAAALEANPRAAMFSIGISSRAAIAS